MKGYAAPAHLHNLIICPKCRREVKAVIGPPGAMACADCGGHSEFKIAQPAGPPAVNDAGKRIFTIDDPRLPLPGVHVGLAKNVRCPEFWRPWIETCRAARHRVPVLVFTNGRSRLIVALAAEDVLAFTASVRATMEAREAQS
jgi:hypothetical protein